MKTAQESPEDRFTQLFDAHYGQILAFARRRVAGDLAQDVVDETFLAAWRHLARCTGDPLPWLYRLAGHAVANQRRTARRGQRLDDRARLMATEAMEPDLADAVADRSGLAAAFARLSESDRELLRLVSWEGLDPARAARVLGCSVPTFKVRLHRARHRFSRAIEAGQPTEAEMWRPANAPMAVNPEENL